MGGCGPASTHSACAMHDVRRAVARLEISETRLKGLIYARKTRAGHILTHDRMGSKGFKASFAPNIFFLHFLQSNMIARVFQLRIHVYI